MPVSTHAAEEGEETGREKKRMIKKLQKVKKREWRRDMRVWWQRRLHPFLSEHVSQPVVLSCLHGETLCVHCPSVCPVLKSQSKLVIFHAVQCQQSAKKCHMQLQRGWGYVPRKTGRVITVLYCRWEGRWFCLLKVCPMRNERQNVTRGLLQV